VPLRRCRSFLALLALAACAPIVHRAAPMPLNRAWTIEPPPVYAVWWDRTERCSGRTGDLSRVEFYAVADWHGQIYLGSQRAEAWWVRRGNRIYLPESALLSEQLVRHEMLHALTRDAGHPAELFVHRCRVLSAVTWADSARDEPGRLASE
jgi:hypothetical protein